jgi:hypothetical protein
MAALCVSRRDANLNKISLRVLEDKARHEGNAFSAAKTALLTSVSPAIGTSSATREPSLGL